MGTLLHLHVEETIETKSQKRYANFGNFSQKMAIFIGKYFLKTKVWGIKNETHSKIGHYKKFHTFCPILMKLGENDYLMRSLIPQVS